MKRPSHKESFIWLLSLTVFVYGVTILIDVLGIRLTGRSLRHTNDITLSISLIGSLSLIYLSTRLRRQKHTAYVVTVAIYATLMATNLLEILTLHEPFDTAIALRRVVIPGLLVILLVKQRGLFRVRSDIESFRVALRTVALILLVTFFYGVIGYSMLDERDYHAEISPAEAAHRTVDQLGLTTSDALMPHTKRAHLFEDSLSIISIASLAYAGLSLFQPLRARYASDTTHLKEAQELLSKSGNDSEEFFKLWPHDKHYYFCPGRQTAIAYKVRQGVALVVADPIGPSKYFDATLTGFAELCQLNDWIPAFVHVSAKHQKLYQKHGFDLQKIGEEAIIDLAEFEDETVKNKYFRQINNRFEKQGYTTELLSPPHDKALLSRLREVSDAWLELPGREERGFMLGYFSDAYMQQCDVMVLRDSAGTIQAFINQIPSYDKQEGNFDLLRHTTKTLGNSNDYLLMKFATHLKNQGFTRLNAGLCPLSGLTGDAEARSVIDTALKFLYVNGDRFYSFSGLRRFKSKYEPEWSPRYLAYKGGITGFTRTVSAMNAAMKVR